jgi:hypothetical protein
MTFFRETYSFTKNFSEKLRRTISERSDTKNFGIKNYLANFT